MLLWSGVGGELFILIMLVVNCAHVLQKNPFAELSGNAQISPDAHPYLQNCIKVEKSHHFHLHSAFSKRHVHVFF